MKALLLGELIDALAAQPQKAKLAIAAPGFLHPKGLISYRGYYEDLAILYESDEEGQAPLVGAFAKTLQSAVGHAFTGYKGGAYVMSRESRVWISQYREVEHVRIDRVYVDGDNGDSDGEHRVVYLGCYVEEARW